MLALDDISLTVEAGSIHGLVGESGSGKSTLARIVMGFDRPDSGTVLLGGVDVQSASGEALTKVRRQMQMVFQDPGGSLDPRQRIWKTVAEPMGLLEPRLARLQRREKVDALLASVGLQPADGDRFPHEFSGGQRQRIAIARALSTNASLIIADEPTSALDLIVQAQVLNLLMDLQETRGLAILFISHDLAVVAALADTVSILHRGRIVETGRTGEVFARPQSAVTAALLEQDAVSLASTDQLKEKIHYPR
ncbi:ABC transporter ATP-binding protein [Mangrovicella endophytica]|uniref:ABC transporter ATP-binding protein n=1 Tax=Mangrovicella endophytica TaxID=2066697 RepID=UPI0018E40BAA|nr:dipeptide/oligopeptide/nickel ABC transporter ATP-binding protein [Mangrovicella endophytica]